MSKLPLEGIRVIDSTYVLAFPYAAGIMADLGAEVIKVEGPSRTDSTRQGAAAALPDNEPGEDPWNRASIFHQVNRGKMSITLDLSREEGREVLKDLIGVSDILMENFTPRVMRRWGLDYPNLKKLKPDIIMVSNTGYGHGDGPYSQYPGQATTQEATHGLTHITGYPGDIPSKAGQSYVDFLACWSGLLGIATALRYRNETGQGQWLDIGMYQLGVYCVGEYMMDWMVNGRRGERIGNRHPWRAPQGCYPSAGEDQWCVISVGDDEEWAALCRVMDRPDLVKDPRFAMGLGRLRHQNQLDAIIAEWTRNVEKLDVIERLQGAGVPAGPVLDEMETNLDSHHWSRGFLNVVRFAEDSGIGRRVLMGLPGRAGKMPVSIKGPAPKLGGHNREVVMGLLGRTEDEYKELEETGIIADRPAKRRPLPTLSMDELVRRGDFAYHDPQFKEKLGI